MFSITVNLASNNKNITHCERYFSEDFFRYNCPFLFCNFFIKFIEWCFHEFHAYPNVSLTKTKHKMSKYQIIANSSRFKKQKIFEKYFHHKDSSIYKKAIFFYCHWQFHVILTRQSSDYLLTKSKFYVNSKGAAVSLWKW